MKDIGAEHSIFNGRKLLLNSKASTNSDFGCPPEERAVREYIRYGMINLDKPAGPTSHEVVSWVKNIMGLKKAGHGGTLDPRVTGVLPIGLEESTKIVQALLPATKEYVCIMRLHGDTPEKRLKEVFKEFTGEILQRPPVKSAVKRQLRTKVIHHLKLLEVQDRDVLFTVKCEAGTYIRKLCHDVGEVLGCGAHMLELRRTKSGPFKEESLVTLHDVLDAYRFWKDNGREDLLKRVIVPVESALGDTPLLAVRDSAVDALCHGADLAVPGISKLDADIDEGDMVGILTLKGEIIALGEAKMSTKDILLENSGIAVKTKRVIMKPGIYPKMWTSNE
ncbi:MAG: RNA-guided pseudouridylation complex pseudouridine synthase subunit Cbf5 [Candidatus Hydrothermarchaeales archaeon]